MMQTFFTIIVVMLLNTFLTTAFLVGGIEYLIEKYEIKRKDNKDEKRNKKIL